MFYLLHCDTHNCVNFQVMIGIAHSKNGVMELLFNYYKQNFNSNKTFESSYDDIKLFNINEENYNFLFDEINKHKEKIEENYNYINYEPECQQSEYVYVILVNDVSQYNIFNKTFHKKYNNIIKNSNEIIV